MEQKLRGPLVALAVVGVTAAGCSGGSSERLAADAPRPADACRLLTSDQVADIVGTPGPFSDAHEDPAPDGSPVWGCTWGTPMSFADLRELTAANYRAGSTPESDETATPLPDVGHQAVLVARKPEGRTPRVYFTVAGKFYDAEVTVDRHGGKDEGNEGREADAAGELVQTVTGS